MAFFDDFTVDYTNKIIRHTSGTTIYPGVTMYSEIQDLWDALNQMDDTVPISAQTPTQFTLLNGWFMTDADLEYINAASIQTSGWASNVIEAIAYDGSGAGFPFESDDRGETITGTTTSATGTIIGWDERYGTETGVLYYRPLTGTFNNTTEAYTVSNSTAAGNFTTDLNASYPLTGESIWSGFNTIGSLSERVAGTPDTKLYLVQDKTDVGLTFGVNTEHASATETNGALGALGAIDILVKTQEMGKVYDSVSNGRVQIFARQQGTLYDHFESVPSTLTANTPIPLAASTDINNVDGTLLVNAESGSGTFTVGEVISDGTKGVVGIVRAVNGTVADPDLDIFEIGDLDIADADALTGASSGATATVSTAGTSAINAGASPQTTITITFARVSRDLVNGNGSKDYSVEIDAQAQTATDVYETLQYRMRRGETTDIDSGAGLAIAGQLYKGIEVRLDYNGGAGAAAAVGELVTGGTSGATGIVASATGGAPGTGYLMVTQLAGTFQTSEQATTTLLTAANVTTVTAIQSSKQGPLMTLAGGVLFGQTGVYITDLASADNQNFSLIADDGTTQTPPNTQAVAVTDLSVGDSVLVVQRDTNGDPLKLPTQTPVGSETVTSAFTIPAGGGGANTQGDLLLEITQDGVPNATIQLDVPDGARSEGSIDVGASVRVRDTVLDLEDRYRFESFATDQFTLKVVANSSGTLDAGGDTSSMVRAASAWATGVDQVLVGDIVRNTADDEVGYVTAVTDTDLTTTVMTNTWASKTYEINRIVRTYSADDTCYVPFVDRIAVATTASNDIIKTSGATGDKSCILRVRRSDGTPILPYDANVTVGDNGLAAPAQRITDSIAT